MLAPHHKLCVEELVCIASFLIGSIFLESSDERTRGLPIIDKAPSSSDDSMDENPHYSDIDESSEEDGCNVMDWDYYLDRRYKRQSRRHDRREEAKKCHISNRQRAKSSNAQRRENHRNARDVVAMAATCSSWRDTLCNSKGAGPDVDSLLWKPFFRHRFPDCNYCSIQNKKTEDISFFSLFQMMMKVSTIQTIQPSCERKQLIETHKLQDLLFVIHFSYQGVNETSYYTSIGTLGTDLSVQLHLPQVAYLFERKHSKWFPGDDDSSNGSRCDRDRCADFPTVDIFVSLTPQKNKPFSTLKIYCGRPNWERDLPGKVGGGAVAAGDSPIDFFGRLTEINKSRTQSLERRLRGE